MRLRNYAARRSGSSAASEVVQTIETQYRKRLQVTFNEARFSVRVKTLEDLGEHDVGEVDRDGSSETGERESAPKASVNLCHRPVREGADERISDQAHRRRQAELDALLDAYASGHA